MIVIQLLEMLKKCAANYRKDANSVSRNAHLTMLKNEPPQDIKDGVIVDFINYVGMYQGLDYALDVEDLKKV